MTVTNLSTEPARFRAIWCIPNPFGAAEIPAISTRMVDKSMKNSTTNRWARNRN